MAAAHVEWESLQEHFLGLFFRCTLVGRLCFFLFMAVDLCFFLGAGVALGVCFTLLVLDLVILAATAVFLVASVVGAVEEVAERELELKLELELMLELPM